jgi:hypothetical protein
MKLFQIEEPDGSPSDPDAPGVAIGIDAGGALCTVAVSVGGNAVILTDREGFERDLPVPAPQAAAGEWQALFEGARLRAERGLARPVTHVVVALAAVPDRAVALTLLQAAAAAGLDLMRIVARDELAKDAAPAEAAAIMAEDLAPRPEGP